MKPLLRVLAILVLLSVASAVYAQQPYRTPIAVAIKDDSTGDLFGSAFRSAFRSLGDIDVVGVSEHPRYVLSGAVICDPQCGNATSYSLALTFVEPLTSTDLVLAFSGTRLVPTQMQAIG